MRTITLFNDNWLFTKENVTSTVTLPHTWNAEDGQTGPQMYYRGKCLYSKSFSKPSLQPGQQAWLEFRGVNSSARVVLNGVELAVHDGGYSTFRALLNGALRDENVLEVWVDNSANDRVYPQRADFTFYGGIYRDVYLIVTEVVHFDLSYFGGKGFQITPKLEGEDAEILFETWTTPGGDRVVASIEGVGETELTLTQQGDKLHGVGSLRIPQVHRWDGLKDPYLYHAKAIAYVGAEAVDDVSDCFGCREFSFDPEQCFFLNGRSYPLRGVSRHQDRAGVGNALTREMHEEDMELILSMGANSIRLAHYQHDQYFYDLCDKKGIIAWAEIPYITVHMDGGRANTISQMSELITQNYNHASIICWALSNEITLNGVTEDLMENHRLLNDLVHRMDPTRVSAMANLFLLETDSPLVKLPDIRGYNLYYGWYVGDMTDNDKWFDEFHAKYPDTVIGLTEYGADSSIALQSPKPEKGDFTESYQAVYHEHMLEMFSTRPYIWGTYCWNMFEFAAAGRDEAGDPGKNHKGLITFDRSQKKDAYYIYKAWWSEEKFVHLCGSRYHDRIEPVTEIKAYTNLSEVTLYVDDKAFETKSGSHVFKFSVPISGVHSIKAVAGEYCDEMEIAKVSTPNPAYFASAEQVRNWFDPPRTDEMDKEGFLSINSTLGEIGATEQGAKILEGMMSRSPKANQAATQQNPAMQAMVARQPLKKVLQQGGFGLDEQQLRELNKMLNKIPKNNG